MNCKRCGFKSSPEAKFCSECGEKMFESCPACKHPVSSNSRLCRECGFKLSHTSEAQTTNYGGTETSPSRLPDAYISIEGERKLVTVLFADVVNYTSIAESLDPEDLRGIINGCWKVLMQEISKYEGTVLQFQGDGLLALFGAPIAHEDHAIRACYTALSIQKALLRYSARVKAQYEMSFLMRIGMDSGLVVVSGIGEDLHMEYTAIGNSTNLAARMQTLARPGTTVASFNTYRLAKDYFLFEPLGKLTIKGRNEPVEAYEVLGAGEVDTRIKVAATRGFSKFVGRQKELEVLAATFSEAASGIGEVVWVGGEAGVGKTRLLYEFKNSLGSKDCVLLHGNCQRYGSSIAYLPLVDILKGYFGIKEGISDTIIKNKMVEKVNGLNPSLGYLLPCFHELLSLHVEDEAFARLDPKMKRERIFEAIKQLLIEESLRKPLIVIVDDLHWIDKTTEAFFSYLIPFLADVPIMLTFMSRTEYVHDSQGKPCYVRLPLGQLDSEASVELIRSLLKRGEVSSELLGFIGVKTGNNPLFIEELVNGLIESGDLKEDDNHWTLLKKSDEIEVPDTVQGIIAARVDRLEDGLKKVVRYASVIGRSFVYPVLESILDEDREDLTSNLQALQKQDFIYKNNLFPEIEYSFKHALVQDVAYHGLLLKRRRGIHGKIGNAIENLYQGRLEEFYEVLAYHYGSAGLIHKAYKYLKLSAIKAEQSSSLWEAFRFYKEAINMLTMDHADDRENMERLVEITCLMVSPMISLGFPEDSLDILQRAEKIARTLGETKNLVTLMSTVGLYYSVKGNPLKGEAYALECLKQAEKTQDVALMAPIVFDLCSNYTARGEFIRLIELAPRMIGLLEETGKERESFERGYNVYSALLAFYGFSVAWMGRFDEGQEMLDRAIKVAGDEQNHYSLGLAEVFYGYSLCYQGYGQQAIPHFEKAVSYLEKGQIFVLLGFAWTGIGYANFFMGNFDQALMLMEKGLAIHLKAGISYNTSVHYFFLSLVYMELGQLEKARLYAGEALKYASENHEVCFVALSKVIQGRIMFLCGESSDDAESCMLEGLRMLTEVEAQPQQAITHLTLVEVSAAKNELKKATQHLWKARRLFKKMKMDYWIARTAPLGLIKEIAKKRQARH